jgi:acetyl-CoA carboxylase biotin carboxylase subunit
MFSKILIANRGEIALRVVRACRELGIASVVVHSTRDRDSAAVQLADEAVQVGPPPPKRSYLNAAAVIEAALRTGAQAVHPGYGFLSEDPDFADACEAAGLVFIGPPAATMKLLGNKQAARNHMARVGLPLLPGTLQPMDALAAAEYADSIGFPVIIKASAGGGGRGMTVVESADRFVAAFRDTQATAKMIFGDGTVYVESYLTRARHVEIQILCDGHGNGVHLGARDCSVQRRHQKLVEESPAPGLSTEAIERIGEASVRAALVAGYQGAGTFEFLLSPDGGFHFMEVNCRIQVEHPVTEMVTGIDLVAAQLRIAAGQPLPFGQNDIDHRGAAVECRINAEDPSRGFAPAAGLVRRYVPAAGPFVRVDTHLRHGDTIAPEYDSLIAKVIAWAPDRPTAIARMRRALHEFEVEGETVRTTRDFLLTVLDDPAFAAGEHCTDLVERLLGSTRP